MQNHSTKTGRRSWCRFDKLEERIAPCAFAGSYAIASARISAQGVSSVFAQGAGENYYASSTASVTDAFGNVTTINQVAPAP